MKYIKLIVLVFVFIALVAAIEFDNSINYAKIKAIQWKDLKLTINETIPIDISKNIKYEVVAQEVIDKKNIFSASHYWVLKKYESSQVHEVLVDVNTDLKIIKDKKSGKVIFKSCTTYFSNNQYYSVIFKDFYNNMLVSDLSGISVYIGKPKTFWWGLNPYEIKGIESFTDMNIIDVKGEWITTIGWINPGLEYYLNPYLYYHIRRFNLKTKEVQIFDSSKYGLHIDSSDLIILEDGNEDNAKEYPIPRYDLSADRRYIYFYGVYNDSAVKENPGFKMTSGIYVYDWWEGRLFKLSDKSCVQITNNTDDGYVYIKQEDWILTKNNWTPKKSYYRFKNPEAMLNELGKK